MIEALTRRAQEVIAPMPSQRTCSIEGCKRVYYVGGYCKHHHDRFRTSAPMVGARSRTALQRFFEKVDVTESCWLWTASRAQGYGHFLAHSYKAVNAHRWLYEQLNGPIPQGMVLDHIVCETRHCVNPDHLRVTTNRANVMRGSSSAAYNGHKTHCIHGHAFTPDNTIIYNGTHRKCRACVQRRRIIKEIETREAT